MSDIRIERQGAVAQVEICRPPHNFFDEELIRTLADAVESLGEEGTVRCIVLCSEGRNFCAGANFGPAIAGDMGTGLDPQPLYSQALRLFRAPIPIVAAIQGAAVGGGLGLALTADFRVAGEGARFTANFNRLGIHPGFGLSVTLPRLIGMQRASLMLYAGRIVAGEESLTIGLVDRLVENEQLRPAAFQLAEEIAASSPIAVRSTRRTLRYGLVEAVAKAVEHEIGEQRQHFASGDFAEGVRAAAEQRIPSFSGR